MERECPFPCSQEPATGNCSKPDKARPQDTILLLYDAF
jgi:hypothetical protein